MKRLSVMALCGLVALSAMFALSGNSAQAFPQFKKEFDAKYVKAAPATDAEKSLAAAVATAKCNVCHMGESKKMHNAYGVALNELLTKDDKMNSEKIQKALSDVESKPAANGASFGDNIKAGKLPTGG